MKPRGTDLLPDIAPPHTKSVPAEKVTEIVSWGNFCHPVFSSPEPGAAYFGLGNEAREPRAGAQLRDGAAHFAKKISLPPQISDGFFALISKGPRVVSDARSRQVMRSPLAAPASLPSICFQNKSRRRG